MIPKQYLPPVATFSLSKGTTMKRLALLFVAAAAPAQSPDIHREALVLDGHVHVMTRQLLEGLDIGDRYPDGHIDLATGARRRRTRCSSPSIRPEPYYLWPP
ncbi:MAG: hypothetical protein R2748_29575 [Bryobacterales bacterium]